MEEEAEEIRHDGIIKDLGVAQLVKCPTLDFGSDHDLTFCEFEPPIGLCADSAEPAWDSLSFSLCLSLPPSLSLSLSK